MYYLAACLLIFISLAHSYLGERYLLTRLFHREDLPKIFGSVRHTKNTLRFAWHLTSVAWLGFALILVLLLNPGVTNVQIANTIGIVFVLHFLVALLGSRGRHFSWIVFLVISIAVLYQADT